MKQPNIEKLQNVTQELAELIIDTRPKTVREWDALERMVSAHQKLAKIDTEVLRQLEFELSPSEQTVVPLPRKDCPRCQGTGNWIDPLDSAESARACPCKDVEDIAWSKIKKEWKKDLALVEAI